MKQDSACAPGNLTLQTTSLPFSEIPEQSRLFVRYQQDPLSLKRFYPSAVGSNSELLSRIPEVLANYKTDRRALCDALERINKGLGAGEKTLSNIDLLRETDCVVTVTGQQAGLFTGPLYTIYKALSAIKMAENLRTQGRSAVPIFWAATEDHDFDEVSKAFVIGADGTITEMKAGRQHAAEGVPVGSVRLDESIRETIDELLEALPKTEFTPLVRSLIEKSWSPGTGYGEAFSRLLLLLLGEYGLIIFDPLDPALKELSAPIYVEALKRSDEIVAALRDRDLELTEAGYHSQVLITEDYFPLFLHAEDGTRQALRRTSDGKIRVKDTKAEYSADQLLEIAKSHPARLSPTVVLRPVVQDYVLPTICYFGGGAEIAYFAQNSEVYRVLKRPATPILHRQSFTVVEARHGRILEKYCLDLKTLFEGREPVTTRIVEEFVSPETARTFADVEEKIDTELNRLDQALSQLDPTLAANLATRRRKIIYHIAALRKKSHSAAVTKNQIVLRQLDTLFTALLPGGHLQERTLNVLGFLNAHGLYFIDWIYDAVDLEDRGHRVINL